VGSSRIGEPGSAEDADSKEGREYTETEAWVYVDGMLLRSGWLRLDMLEMLGRPLEMLGRPLETLGRSLETLGRDTVSKLALSGEKFGTGGTLPPGRMDIRDFDFTDIADMRLDAML
jgi:hypothetical protein